MIREQEREKISYLALNSPSDDAEMGAAVDDIVTSLFCALVSNGQVRAAVRRCLVSVLTNLLHRFLLSERAGGMLQR